MPKGSLSDTELDTAAYARAERQFRLVQQVLEPQAVETLAQEVVRRLAFRIPRRAVSEGMPTPEQIDRLCAALLSTQEVAADRIILAARRDGASPDFIYLGFVAGAARQLGVMWEEDRISFAQVTVGTARLYRIIRGLRHVIDGATHDHVTSRQVLFALVAGDSHTLGIEMATDLFRRDGWDVELSVGELSDDIVKRTDVTKFEAVVLVANSEKTLPSLISLVLAIRISQPMAHIVVAGNILKQRDDIGDLAGVDDTIPDIETAIERLRTIIAPSK